MGMLSGLDFNAVIRAACLMHSNFLVTRNNLLFIRIASNQRRQKWKKANMIGSDWLLVLGLLVIVLMASLASCGWDIYEMRNREVWWWTGMLGIEAILMADHNAWMAALLALF